MRQSAALLAVVVLLALGFITLLVNRQSAAQAPAVVGPVTMWEYKTIDQDLEALMTDGARSYLNRLGNEGWELCVAVDNNRQRGAYLILKRPVKMRVQDDRVGDGNNAIRGETFTLPAGRPANPVRSYENFRLPGGRPPNPAPAEDAAPKRP